MRVAVVGATGALGSELLVALDESQLPIDALVPIGTDRSLGTDVEFQGRAIAVETGLDTLRGCELAFLCAPPAASLEAVRLCLHAKVPAIDCSGALAGAPEVPLVVEPSSSDAAWRTAPVVTLAAGTSLAALRVLLPLSRAFGVTRVVATLVESASGAGRRGVQALSEETIALLSQHDAPEPSLGHLVAFDVLPWIGEIDAEGACDAERRFTVQVARALEGAPSCATALRAPVFCGDGVALAIETAKPASAADAIEALAKAEGIELAASAPTTRTAAGSESVHVGRVRRDPSRENGLLLWIAADGLRLTAAHAVRIAAARCQRV